MKSSYIRRIEGQLEAILIEIDCMTTRNTDKQIL